MLPAEFEHTIPASEWHTTHALDCVITRNGKDSNSDKKSWIFLNNAVEVSWPNVTIALDETINKLLRSLHMLMRAG
jgi:hypothetical protein